MNHRPVQYAGLLLAAAISSHVQAQQNQTLGTSADTSAGEQNAVQLDRITVTTGSRTAKAVDKIPGAITVVSAAEVQHTLLLTEDATAVLARTVPGYAESSQQMSNSGETLRGRTALRLFDGIPQTSPLREGNRSGTFTDMGVIGRIEVINGPSASEGIGASGGIINYISKTPEEGTHTQIVSRYSTQSHDDSEGWKLGVNFGHKQDSYDVLVSAALLERGMPYDGNGRRIGLRGSGTLADSESRNLFLKGGINFGEDGSQRLQASISRFKVEGNGNYIGVPGNRAQGITNTAERGRPLGGKTEFNDFEQAVLSYMHQDLFGGTLTVDAYKADQAMRYPAESGSDKQDPLLAPLGTLVDQSEIHSRKKGMRGSWTRQDLFSIEGLEMRAGLDVVEDESEQSLALTGRLWVPPMLYKSTAPYVQLSYDIGPVTLSGGLRREDGELSVDSYTTTWFRNRVFVGGGQLDYQANLPNFGAIVRLPADWSVFASYGKGFSLPNVGIPLRNINKPGQSVDGILDLQAVLVDNKEIGVNWRGAQGSFGGSYYDSESDLGVSLAVDPVTSDYIMLRQPVHIKGYELNGSLNLSEQWRANAIYSHIEGKTSSVSGGPLNREMGVSDINPDKFAGSFSWKFMPRAELTLGATRLFSRDLNEGTTAVEHTTGYTLYDLAASYDTGRYGKLSLGVENVTDKFYILSYSQIGGQDNYMSGRGRVISLTHSITF
ncbi:MAG: TonB-dependent receptor [Pseudoxanthomonas sp.]